MRREARNKSYLSLIPTALVTVSPPATPEETSARIVTLDDDAQTITLRVSERFLLKLGEDYDWTVTVADESVVSCVIGVLVVRGAQGVYEIHRPGSTTLSTTGDPVCRRSLNHLAPLHRACFDCRWSSSQERRGIH